MIALGYLMKTKHVLEQEDSQVLMKIIINITMPAALIAGFRTFSIDISLLFALLLGFCMNGVLLLAGSLASVCIFSIRRVKTSAILFCRLC